MGTVETIDIGSKNMLLQDIIKEGDLLSDVLVMGNQAMALLYGKLKYTDFYSGYYSKLYDVMTDIYSHGGNVSDLRCPQYAAFMKDMANIIVDRKNGATYFLEMIDSGLQTALENIIWYRDQIIKWSKARGFIKMYHNLINNMNPDISIEEIDEMMCQVADVIQTDWRGMVDISVKSLNDAAGEYSKLVEDMQKSGLRLGIPEFDRVYNYILPGDVVIVIARPGVGKTNFACSQQLDLWEKQKVKSIFFSLEMTAARLWERQAAMVNMISQLNIQDMFINGMADEPVVKFHSQFDKGVYFVDAPQITLKQIEGYVNRMRDVRAIFIDYLSLVESEGRTIYEATSGTAHGLKALAKATNSVVFCLAQTKRNGGPTEEVTIEDGRDSGEIEAAADVMIGLWIDSDNEKIIDTALLKARNAGQRVHGVKSALTFIRNSPRLRVAEEKRFR